MKSHCRCGKRLLPLCVVQEGKPAVHWFCPDNDRFKQRRPLAVAQPLVFEHKGKHYTPTGMVRESNLPPVVTSETVTISMIQVKE